MKIRRLIPVLEKAVSLLEMRASSCGAGSPGAPGFSENNTCNRHSGGSSLSEPDAAHLALLDSMIKSARKATGSTDNTLESHCEPFAEKLTKLLRAKGETAKIVGFSSDSEPVHHVFVETSRKGVQPRFLDASGIYKTKEALLKSFEKANEDEFPDGFGDWEEISADVTETTPALWKSL